MSKNTTTDAISGFIAVCIAIALFFSMIFGIGALESYIIRDLAHLFNVPKLIEMSFMQIYGLAIIVGLLTNKLPKKDREDEYNGWVKLGLYATSFLLTWGTAHLFYHFFS